MSNIWTFSPSSEVLLKRCVELTNPQDPNNKWIKRFRKKDEDLNKSLISSNENNKANILEVCDSETEIDKIENPKIIESESQNEFLEGIELEPVLKFDFMVLECLQNSGTTIQLAERLSVNAIEKISNNLFSTTDISKEFLDVFHANFIPTFLKRECSRLSLDILVNANKTYPLEFKKTLNVIFKDLEIPNKILYDFTQSLTEEEKLKFLNTILENNLTPEQFHHNLFTIYTTYKDCLKNAYVQNCMEKLLIDNAELCATDRNFGKLLMTFLQAQKNIGAFKQSASIEKAIEINRTPFRKPCLNVFREISENYSLK